MKKGCVPKNNATAEYWYRQAAAQGHALAQDKLREMQTSVSGASSKSPPVAQPAQAAATTPAQNTTSATQPSQTKPSQAAASPSTKGTPTKHPSLAPPPQSSRWPFWIILIMCLIGLITMNSTGFRTSSSPVPVPVESPSFTPPQQKMQQESHLVAVQKVAEQGNAYAQYTLGTMYLTGNHAPKDEHKAIELFLKAANQGYAAAQLHLGLLYEGSNLKDDRKAAEWYQKAAAQGVAQAQVNLGNMYLTGRGVPKDTRKAVEWYRKAAAQGDTYAKNALERLK